VTVSSALANDSPPLVGTTRVDDTERVHRDVIFDLDNRAEELSTVSSHISTEMFDNDEALCRIYAEFLSSNINLVGDIIVLHATNSTNVQPNETGSSIFYFGNDELNIAKEYYTTQLRLTAGDHDKKVKAELSSIFETPHYKSPIARSIIFHAVKLLPLPQPPCAPARTNPSDHRATQLRSVIARVYAVSIQNQITTTVP
jgi:hypothetical protein